MAALQEVVHALGGGGGGGAGGGLGLLCSGVESSTALTKLRFGVREQVHNPWNVDDH